MSKVNVTVTWENVLFYCCYFISNHSDEYEFTFPGLDIGTVDMNRTILISDIE